MEAPMEMPPTRSELTGTQCIRRSFGIVRHLAGGDQDGEKLVDIAAALKLPHPTAHRILKALEEEGIVERAEGSQRYRLAAETAWLGVEPFNRCPITRYAARYLDELAQTTGEAVLLSVPSHTDSVYADRRVGKRPMLIRQATIGSRRPLGASIGGRVMLAFMGLRRLEAVLRDNAERHSNLECTEDTIRSSLADARARGYLIGASALSTEGRELAVPVLDVTGKSIGAISLIGPCTPMFEHRSTSAVPLLRKAAQQISDHLHQLRLSA